MTVSGTTTSLSFTGNGSTTAFAVSFPFQGTLAASEITVVQRTIATGAEVTLDYTTHYTVAGGNGSTGVVTAGTAPADTVQWHIRRNTATTQTSDYVANDPFSADTIERNLDRQAMAGQERDSDIAAAFKFPDTYTAGASTTMPEPVALAYLQFNAAGNALTASALATIGAATFPGSSTDNTLPRFSGTSGTALQGSLVTVDDNSLLSASGGLGFAKGGDITSASPLVIDTDGGMFDVAGTTGFSAMTVAVGRLFILQFDGALVMTHGAGTLDLGGSNITTAAGDAGIFYATAANVVRLVGWVKVGGVGYLASDNVWAGAQRTTVTALTSSSNSIAITLGSSNDFSHTFTEATTLANPSDTAVPGQKGTIYLTQHASSPKTLAYGSEYDFAGGTAITVTAANSARDSIDYVVRADGKIELSGLLNLS